MEAAIVTQKRGILTTVESPTYKPTKAELAAIHKGEAEIARGEYVTLAAMLFTEARSPGAVDCSPRRKPWDLARKRFSPGGA
jgi:hypothetical protein